ncbi:MAG TPA: TadE/TadG family type IV pilus assembly protein [bacterium]|nr:TadE/TadG family type IV pilus assembly protein [bacterium]
MVEFTLAVPLLFLLFLGTIQLAYLSYFYFAVQRAAFAICRDAAASPDPEKFDPTFDLAASLLPLLKLHPQILLSILGAECRIQASGRQVDVSLRCPMPLWVPPFARLFGQGQAFPIPAASPDLAAVLAPLHLPAGILAAAPAAPMAVHWFNFSASALNEDGVTGPSPAEAP